MAKTKEENDIMEKCKQELAARQQKEVETQISSTRFKKALGAKRAVRHCLEELLLKRA
jgi:hypothetical protein